MTIKQAVQDTIHAYAHLRLSDEDRRTVLSIAQDVTQRLTAEPTRPARVDVPAVHKHPQMKPFASIPWLVQVAINRHFMETTGRGANAELLEHVIAEKRDAGLCRMAFYGADFARPKPVTERSVIYAGKDAVVDHKKGLAVEAQLRRRYGVQYHIETSLQPRGLLIRVWHGADWLMIKTSAFHPAEVARTFAANLTQLAIMAPQAQTLQARKAAYSQGGSTGGKKSAVTKAEKRKEKGIKTIEDYRPRWEELKRKGYSDRSAGTIMQKETGKNRDAITKHFREPKV